MLAILKLAKVLAVALAVGGSVAVFLIPDPASRRMIALRLVAPGVCVAWLVGFLLVNETGVSFLSTWILIGMASSFCALQVVLFYAARPGRPRRASALAALTLWFVTVALMVLRPDW